MTRLERLDSFLIDQVFQRFAHRTQTICGVDSLQWAKFFLVGKLIAILLAVGASIYGATVSHAPLLLVLLVNLINLYVAWTLAKYALEKYVRMRVLERLLPLAQAQRAGNPFRLAFARSRTLSLLVSFLLGPLLLIVPDLFGFWVTVCWLLGTIIEYFLACDPLPPQKSKVRQWLESWKKIRVLEPALEH